MKIAIPLFGNRISPRFDFSPEMWMITVENNEVVHQEKLTMANLNLPQRLAHLTSYGVNQVICGGIDEFCLGHLSDKEVAVFHNVVGEAEIAFHLFMEGKLRSDCCCERRGKHPSGLKHGPPWKEESHG
jgi:predicted Fe-Mo cluster-binding NifX family protein